MKIHKFNGENIGNALLLHDSKLRNYLFNSRMKSKEKYRD